MPNAKVCLNMIVKNEAHVIRRCLDSVRPFVDHWIIVDTGSTDGTQDIVRSHFAGIPGELHERPWRDFGYNRTQALELARGKGDYVLIMDADNIFCTPPDWRWPRLTADAYDVTLRSSGSEYVQCILVSNRFAWRYVGVLHEYITCDSPHRKERLEGPWVDRRHEGARSRDPETFRKDAAILEQGLRDEPGNARYAFYLAQSWRDAGEPAKARDAYLRRATMPGWDEETWYALYEAARLAETLGAPLPEIQGAYLATYQARPRRAEPLYQLARLHRQRNEFALAYLFAKRACAIPAPPDILFVDSSVYQWRCIDELSVAASYVGELDEGRAAVERLLGEGHLPASERPRVETNLHFYQQQVKDRAPPVTPPAVAATRPAAERAPDGQWLADLLRPSRLTEVIDVGANPIDGVPPYRPLLAAGLCNVTGFEPQPQALEELQGRKGPHERYLPDAVGDGTRRMLNVCRASGMTSVLEPEAASIALFDELRPLAEVVGRVEIQTRRLDDIDAIEHMDFLKIDIQGGELDVFRNAAARLAGTVAIQTEVSFVTLYTGQPTVGEIDTELRRHGFVPHCFAEVKRWPIDPCIVGGNGRRPLNQLLEGDLVYVRDMARADAMSDEQLKHLALVAHYCYGSFDLALRCVMLLEKRGALAAGAQQRYVERMGREEGIAGGISLRQ